MQQADVKKALAMPEVNKRIADEATNVVVNTPKNLPHLSKLRPQSGKM
jgi:hypothetical protein